MEKAMGLMQTIIYYEEEKNELIGNFAELEKAVL